MDPLRTFVLAVATMTEAAAISRALRPRRKTTPRPNAIFNSDGLRGGIFGLHLVAE
jgi:hypothetical protein